MFNLWSDRRNGWTCTLEVSPGQKRVGDGLRKIAEVWGVGVEFLPLSLTVREEAHGEGDGNLGNGGLVHLEC